MHAHVPLTEILKDIQGLEHSQVGFEKLFPAFNSFPSQKLYFFKLPLVSPVALLEGEVPKQVRVEIGSNHYCYSQCAACGLLLGGLMLCGNGIGQQQFSEGGML